MNIEWIAKKVSENYKNRRIMNEFTILCSFPIIPENNKYKINPA